MFISINRKTMNNDHDAEILKLLYAKALQCFVYLNH
jgi:hypothetical protein